MIRYRNIWRHFEQGLDNGQATLESLRDVFKYLDYLHNAPLRDLRACAPYGEAEYVRRYPATGLPFVAFELCPRNRSPEGEAIVIWYPIFIDLPREDVVQMDDPESYAASSDE